MSFRRDAAYFCGGASDAALPLFVGLSKAGRFCTAQLSDKAVWRLVHVARPGCRAGGPGAFLWAFPAGRAGDGGWRGEGGPGADDAADPAPLGRGRHGLPAAGRDLAAESFSEDLGKDGGVGQVSAAAHKRRQVHQAR